MPSSEKTKKKGGSQQMRDYGLHPVLSGLRPDAKDQADLLKNKWTRDGFRSSVWIILAAAGELVLADPRLFGRLRELAEEIQAGRHDAGD